ncbi:MAG: DUF4838 domain-containing protein [Planctomycetes bacterium]|nr:DUF4838 domain-containing protein [Planctomycetota bacterium]
MPKLLPFLALLSLPSLLVAEPIPLARGGQPAATIVLPDKPHERLKLAADELQGYVRKVCGVELPVRADGKRVSGAGLYIGPCEPSLPSDLPAATLNPETYAIRVREGNVFFAGRHPTPTYFAVASFIEDALGVRWFAPGDTWEYVPTGKPGELTVEAREIVKTPDTSPRIWSGHAWVDSWRRWNLRNKTVLSEVVPRRQFQNFLHRVFPPDKYAKTNPDFFPLIADKRWIPPADGSHWRPCESNPEVLRLTAEYARKWFDEHPTVDSFSLGMDDISHLCSCPGCRRLDPRPDSYEKREFSDRHYKFVNAVAREVAKTHPDRYIGTLIYAIARKLPETVPKLEDNVFGFITETSALWWQPGRQDADHELTREWRKRCKHLSRYDYYGMGTFTPRFYPHSMAEQVKFDKSLGLEGMYTEVYTFLPHTAPMIWAFAKLQWDASLDIDALLREFHAKMFGRAAGTMGRYFDLLEKSWNTPRPGREGWVHRNIVRQALAMSPEDVDAGMALLAQAMKEADSDAARQRIDTIRAALQYAGYAIKAHALSQACLSGRVTNAQEAATALSRAEEIMRLAADREPFWAEAMKRPDLLGENLRGLGGQGYLVTGQVARLEVGATVGALAALAWYAQNAPGELAKIRARFVETAPASDAANAVRAYLSVQETKPPNLLMNPGFEDRGENVDKAEKDWETKGAPKGWSLWSRQGDSEFKVRSGVGLSGSAAATISGGSGGTYLQAVKAQPGQRYLCVAWGKTVGSGGRMIGQFGVRFQKPDGSWHPRRDLEPQVSLVPAEDWQPLILFVTVPDGAGQFVIMPGAPPLGPGASVLFDDVAVYRLLEK